MQSVVLFNLLLSHDVKSTILKLSESDQVSDARKLSKYVNSKDSDHSYLASIGISNVVLRQTPDAIIKLMEDTDINVRRVSVRLSKEYLRKNIAHWAALVSRGKDLDKYELFSAVSPNMWSQEDLLRYLHVCWDLKDTRSYIVRTAVVDSIGRSRVADIETLGLVQSVLGRFVVAGGTEKERYYAYQTSLNLSDKFHTKKL